MKDLEHQEQCIVIAWAKVWEERFPDLALLLAIPNGGNRNIVTAMKLKKEGVRPGVPDLFLPAPKPPYAGLWIEMKAGKGRISKYQKAWHQALRGRGYRVAVCWGAEKAIHARITYLGMTEGEGV
jgi:hypothetical protein